MPIKTINNNDTSSTASKTRYPVILGRDDFSPPPFHQAGDSLTLNEAILTSNASRDIPSLISLKVWKRLSIFFGIMFIASLIITLILLFLVNLPITSALVLGALSSTFLSVLALSITLYLGAIPYQAPIDLHSLKQNEKQAIDAIHNLRLPISTVDDLKVLKNTVNALIRVAEQEDCPVESIEVQALKHSLDAAISLEILMKILETYMHQPPGKTDSQEKILNPELQLFQKSLQSELKKLNKIPETLNPNRMDLYTKHIRTLINLSTNFQLQSSGNIKEKACGFAPLRVATLTTRLCIIAAMRSLLQLEGNPYAQIMPAITEKIQMSLAVIDEPGCVTAAQLEKILDASLRQAVITVLSISQSRFSTYCSKTQWHCVC